jgi:hypothetical protein
MALIKVERFIHHADCEISRVYIRDKFFCFAIEDAHRTTKIKGETCIPPGTYELGVRHSPYFTPRLGHEMIWVKNVPGFEYILIHTGNTISDTDGCLIVGKSIGTLKGKDGVVRDAVLTSKPTYFELYASVIDDIRAGGQKIEYTTI